MQDTLKNQFDLVFLMRVGWDVLETVDFVIQEEDPASIPDPFTNFEDSCDDSSLLLLQKCQQTLVFQKIVNYP